MTSLLTVNASSGELYFYAPNKGAPIFFAAAFAISGLIHLWQCMSVSTQLAKMYGPLMALQPLQMLQADSSLPFLLSSVHHQLYPSRIRGISL